MGVSDTLTPIHEELQTILELDYSTFIGMVIVLTSPKLSIAET